MVLEMCRLCLSRDNLVSLFEEKGENERNPDILASTTGLTITPNDGYPQQICADCIKLLNNALKLRKQSQIAKEKLDKLFTEQANSENIISIEIKDQNENENVDLARDISMDCYDFSGFKIEVEMDRISQDGGDLIDEKAASENKQLAKFKKRTRKETRELYMSMVEGDFNPNGPIICKICKNSVSKWVCFVNHAKKHLGCKVICEFCGKDFMSSNQLKRHCRSFHGMERELKCKLCSYLALDKAQLVVHERRAHTGDRPYVCDTCAAAYFSRKCLLQHIESHRTDSSEQCDQCQAFFKSRRHLAKHKYAAHSDKRRARRREKRLAQNKHACSAPV